jgi:hypothetical protein
LTEPDKRYDVLLNTPTKNKKIAQYIIRTSHETYYLDNLSIENKAINSSRRICKDKNIANIYIALGSTYL